MDMTGQYKIAAAREKVWAALNDPKVLKACIPGCEELSKLSDTEMEATALVALGPVKAKFKGKVRLSDLNKPESYTLSGEGQGGAAGFAKGEAKVKLTAEGDETLLDYAVKANIGGRLAQMGQRLIDGAAKKMADDFFAKFAVEASGGKPAAKIKLPDLSPSAIPAQRAKPGIPVLDPPIWIPIAIAIISIVVLFATLVR
jgi:uncharacterized protein